MCMSQSPGNWSVQNRKDTQHLQRGPVCVGQSITSNLPHPKITVQVQVQVPAQVKVQVQVQV